MAKLADIEAPHATEPAGEARIANGRLSLTIRPGAVVGWFVVAFAVLMAINLAILPWFHGEEDRVTKLLARFFLFDMESSFPTFLNFALLVFNAALLAVSAARATAAGDRWRRHWLGLAVIFLFLAYDEAAAFHENLGSWVKAIMATDGYLTFAWVVPGALFVLVLGLIYLRFLLDMPRGRAALFVIAGGLYVCGAIGMEMLGGDYAFENGTIETARYLLLTSVEETMEMGGLLLFAYVLMRGLARPDGRIGLSLDV